MNAYLDRIEDEVKKARYGVGISRITELTKNTTSNMNSAAPRVEELVKACFENVDVNQAADIIIKNTNFTSKRMRFGQVVPGHQILKAFHN